MRLDRAITLGLVGPVRRLCAVARSPVVRGPVIPVLMYHSISGDPEPGVSPYYRVNTAPSVFREHMQFLADHGYRTITVGELASLLAAPQSDAASLHHSITPSTPLVCITFDDGFGNFYTEAFPVLQRHGFTATMFLPTAFIGDTPRPFRPAGAQSKIENRKSKIFPDCLTWSQVKELHRAGLEFGSHTVTHPKLVELDWCAISSELSNSKAEIEAHLGAPVASFCYPYAFPQADGEFSARFTDLLAETGYRSCSTTALGRVRSGDDPFRLKRLPANSLDDTALLAAKLSGSYDWLGSIQSLSKKLRRHRSLRRPAEVPGQVGSAAADVLVH